ncbi:PREDICTED: mucin-3B-like [Cyprinodon variegatus]|uniref:mucin-3B-like n=1 Tax=Cyprinodon variegatus TaxID=28743 RepID=UPI0007427862|nr:PREDICTED: mucin-3B-like [Cyprinodon variegatus]
MTLGDCQCICQDFVFGDVCSHGANETTPHIGALPTRNANITLEIYIDYQDAYKDINSNDALEFIKKLQPELEALCKRADPESFEAVQVIKLTNGSVISESVVMYSYQNNDTHIRFLNTRLEDVLTDIFNDTKNLDNVSQVFSTNVSFNGLSLHPPMITDIEHLEPFVDCSHFKNYTAEIIRGVWQCVGPCKTNHDYCQQRGDCFNDINKGPVCRCYQNSFEQYYGTRCESFRRGPGFYGALFGSLAIALLLLITIITIT